jgi:predicted transcriptional regulator
MGNREERSSVEQDLLSPKPGRGEELRDVLSKRSDILRAVVDEPATKRELIDTVDVSRSTIDRGIRSLESISCVEHEDGRYVATTKGTFALAEYRRYTSTTDRLGDGTDILNWLPTGVEIHTDFLRNMTVHSRDSEIPDAVLEYSNELLQSTTRLRGFAPVALTSYPDLINDGIEERGMNVELVIENSVFNSLRNIKGNVLSKLDGNDNVELYIYENSLPYALWIMEHDDGVTAGITVYGNGAVQGILTNDSPAAVTWAREMYREYRDQAIDIVE